MPSQVTFLGGPMDLQRHVLPGSPDDVTGRSYFYPVMQPITINWKPEDPGPATITLVKAEYVVRRVYGTRTNAPTHLVGIYVGEA